MPIQIQNSDASSPILVESGDSLVVTENVNIAVAGTAVTLAEGGTSKFVNHGNIFGGAAVSIASDDSSIVNYGTLTGVAAGAIVIEDAAFNQYIFNPGSIISFRLNNALTRYSGDFVAGLLA